jgi:hypothetical protein
MRHIILAMVALAVVVAWLTENWRWKQSRLEFLHGKGPLVTERGLKIQRNGAMKRSSVSGWLFGNPYVLAIVLEAGFDCSGKECVEALFPEAMVGGKEVADVLFKPGPARPLPDHLDKRQSWIWTLLTFDLRNCPCSRQTPPTV